MPTTPEFERRYGMLNPRQKEAVDAIDGPVMVIAGPGTGKTTILTLRIANILTKTDTPPDAILALTFTESGAAEMKSRLAAFIGTDAYRVTMTTFHSFCNGIIQEYPESFGALAGAASLAETDQAVLVQELIDTTAGLELLRPVNAPDLYLKAVLASINTLKREDVEPERLRQIAEQQERAVMTADDLHHEKGAYKGTMKGVYVDALKQASKLKELAAVYQAYQRALRERKLYDYNDMVMEVARTLRTDEELRLLLQERYHYFLVDEHQDTNNAQNTVIELLASFWERPNLFVVGDAKQAIYRFQGASAENFTYFQNKYPEVRLIELDANYRSSQVLLNAAHGIRPSGGDGLHAQSVYPDAPISLFACSDPDAQSWIVTQRIREYIEQGTPPEQIAVLYRDNADGLALAEFLQRANIPYAISATRDMTADPLMRQLLAILDAAAQFGSAEALYPALHAPVLAIDPLDLYKLIDACRQGRNPYDVMRSPALMHQAGIDDAPRMQALAASLARWSRQMRQPTAAETLELVVRESGVLDAAVADADSHDRLALLHGLYDRIRSHVQRDRALTLAAFVEHLAFLRERGISLTAKGGGVAPGKVRLMTAHKSKGLEFDVVVLIDCVDGHWGSRTRRSLIKLPPEVFAKPAGAVPSAPEGDDEERNLFYVALTRARRQVILALPERDRDGNEQLPARYIADIRPELVVRPEMAAAEEAWTAARAVRFAAAPERAAQIGEKAFLNDLFTRQGLSVTALNNYLACPWRYFYSNLVRIPEAPAFALMYGNAVDRALQEYFDKLREGERGTKAELCATFERFLADQPLQTVELARARARGIAALSAYYDRYHSEWHANIINQLRIPAVELADGLILNGKIDKVELLDASGAVRVIDYKTGAPKSRGHIAGTTKSGDGNYLRQLVFYKLLLDRWQNGRYRTGVGVIDFVEPDERGKLHREEFALTPAMVSELEAIIQRVAQEIRELTFWNARCDDRDCRSCALRAGMKGLPPASI